MVNLGNGGQILSQSLPFTAFLTSQETSVKPRMKSLLMRMGGYIQFFYFPLCQCLDLGVPGFLEKSLDKVTSWKLSF